MSLHLLLLKNSCESIVESFVSQYEKYFDIRRNLDEDSINEEFQIAVNGPSLAHCDSVVKEAMDLYWSKNTTKGGKDRWHFFRRTDLKRTKYPFTSSTLTKFSNMKEALPFMK